MYFAVDVTELLKGDILKRYQAYAIELDKNFIQPDEVRYKEDMSALGLDFIKLGLNDVLYNPKTKQVYTPNTNQTTDISTRALEERKYVQLDNGKMNGSTSEKGGGSVDNSGESGIIKGKTKYAPSPRATSGGITINPKTFSKVRGEFNTKYPNAPAGTLNSIIKGKYSYLAKADGNGSIVIIAKYKE